MESTKIPLIPKLNRINLVGVELEGGWSAEARKKLQTNIYGDGSVRVSADYIGELCSEPLKLEQLWPFIDLHHPTVVDRSCGLHVHMSFRSKLDYMRLMDEEFFKYFYSYMEKWAIRMDEFGSLFSDNDKKTLKSRIAGNNDYCRRRWDADRQAVLRHKEGARYTGLNFCYSLHKTMECRLLPMFSTSSASCVAVSAVLGAVEVFLEHCREKNRGKDEVRQEMLIGAGLTRTIEKDLISGRTVVVE